MSGLPEVIRVARVLRPHGVAGEVSVELLGGERGRLVPGMRLRASAGEIVLESVRGDGSHLICRFAGIGDRDAAASLSGVYLEVASAELRPLPPGEYFHFQLIGLEVEDPQGRTRGELVDVEAYPAHDIYVVRSAAAELRVPAVKEAVLGIDLERHRVTVAERYLEAWVDAV
ncbi:MAG TPA: ribosome maturation factor RimM [Candidatus Dormibacteraeota bacterium]|nr:ribosome maturation factor RimM [Candidatus Dormibacteraeota bacterium]